MKCPEPKGGDFRVGITFCGGSGVVSLPTR